MNTLAGYGSDDEDQEPSYKSFSVNTAPSVALVARQHASMISQTQRELRNNVTADVMLAPVEGPANPFKFNAVAPGAKQAGMGIIEDTVVEDFTFDEQYQTYQRSGFAMDLSTNAVLGNVAEYLATNGETAQSVRGQSSVGFCTIRSDIMF
jgi:pre-mRNA-processing factor 17